MKDGPIHKRGKREEDKLIEKEKRLSGRWEGGMKRWEGGRGMKREGKWMLEGRKEGGRVGEGQGTLLEGRKDESVILGEMKGKERRKGWR